MANPIQQQITGTTTGTAVILDAAQTPFNVSFGLAINGGTCAYTVQFTLDNPNAAIDYGAPGYLSSFVNSTVTWITDANVTAATTVAAVGNYMFPVRALRCSIQSASTTGTLQAVFTVLQGNPPSGG
jgi:hypothetical protein